MTAISSAETQNLAEVIETLSSFSIPLYFEERGEPVLFGTGFFVRHGKYQYLVSAAHVLDRAKNLGLYFYSAPNIICSLVGKLRLTGKTGSRQDDRIDIGVLKLSSEIAPPFPAVKKFAFEFSYLKPKRLPRTDRHYVIIGFPANKSKADKTEKTVLASPYAYRSDPVDDNAFKKFGLSPETHVILPLDRKRGFDPLGKVTHFPKPHGMSGAPIMVLHENGSGSRIFPVVGVGIEYRERSKVLIGTDIGFVMDMIRHAF